MLKPIAAFLLLTATAFAHDTAFLAAPRTTGKFLTQSVSERNGPYVNANAQLIIRGQCGEERILVDSGALDFAVSLDGKSLFVSRVAGGKCDIYRVDVTTGAGTKLTDGGGWNCQPVELPGGDIAFLSNRDGWKNPHENYRAFTIYRMSHDGSKQQRIWHAGLGGVFGLSLGGDGRLYFSSGENQGLRVGHGNQWSIWSINPDGSDFAPELSAIPNRRIGPWDWPVTTSDGSLAVAQYYDTRIYGAIQVAPREVKTPFGSLPKFGNPITGKNPPIANGWDKAGENKVWLRFGFQRAGFYSLCSDVTSEDWQGRTPDGYTGMLSHPASLPGNGVLLTWTGDEGDNAMDLGVYRVADVTEPVEHPSELEAVVDNEDRHEWFGKAVVPFAEIYGRKAVEPHGIVAEDLPAGTAYGVIGTSSVDVNEWAGATAMVTMPADAAEWVRILAFQPTLDRKEPGVARIENNGFENFEGFHSQVNERIGWYEQLIPLKKYRSPGGELHIGPNPPAGYKRISRGDGMPDTSWQAEIPANQPWSLQLLNAKKEAIVGSTAQTWHQVIPREKRVNCAGCHAHWKPDQTPFENTFANLAEYKRPRLNKIVDVVWDRDIEPMGLGIPKRWWAQAGGPKSYQSSAFSSPLLTAATPAQRETIAAWIDTGMMAAGTKDGATITPGMKIGPYTPWVEAPK